MTTKAALIERIIDTAVDVSAAAGLPVDRETGTVHVDAGAPDGLERAVVAAGRFKAEREAAARGEPASARDGDGRPYPVPTAEDFRDPEWVPPDDVDEDDLDDLWPVQEFIPARDLEGVARRLIDANESFGHLRSLRLAWRWKREGGKTRGKATLGKCTKASGLLRHFADLDFVFWLAADHARSYRFSRQQVEAAVYHELCHAGTNDDGVACVWEHDFAGFGGEIERYGSWTADLRRAETVFRQLPLDLGTYD